jgi:hypothetical protein
MKSKMVKNRSGGSGPEILNREMGHGKSKSVSEDNSHEAGKAGYHRYDVGGVEDPNYRIEDGYVSKDESPSRSENSKIHDIAHHSVTGELYSGHPERHGHLGKVYSSAPADGGSDKGHDGGGKDAEG